MVEGARFFSSSDFNKPAHDSTVAGHELRFGQSGRVGASARHRHAGPQNPNVGGSYPPAQGQSPLPRIDPRAMHTAIDVHEQDLPTGPFARRLGHDLFGESTVAEKATSGKHSCNFRKRDKIGADRLVSQQDVEPARHRRHLGLGDSGTLESG